MTDSTPTPNPKPTSPTARWWIAKLILLLGFIAVVIARLAPAVSHQQTNLRTMITVLITLAVLVLWALLLSGFSWKRRVFVLLGVILAIGLLRASVRIEGVTGDLVPIFVFRWTPRKNEVVNRPTTPAIPAPAAAASATLPTFDYPQFLGPNHNGEVPALKLVRDWKANPPTRLWRQRVGPAWSGFAIVGNRAVTQEQRGEEESVTCYDAQTGTLLWSHGDKFHYLNPIAGEGPRANPTIASNRVFTIGADGLMNCLDLATGKLFWSHELLKEHKARTPEWGVSSSALVLGTNVIVSPGGHDGHSLVAYDIASGNTNWSGGNSSSEYSTPVKYSILGQEQILVFNHSLEAHDANKGTPLWSYPWPGGHPHVSTPVLLPGDKLLLSSGYGTGSALLQVEKGSDGKFSAKQIWKTNRLKAKFANLFHINGFIYGLDDGIMACLDAATGDLKWKEGRYGHGQIIRTGELMIIMAESGDVVLFQPDPSGPRELTRFKAFEGKTWNPAALAGNLLIIRNDAEAAAYRLPLEPVK